MFKLVTLTFSILLFSNLSFAQFGNGDGAAGGAGGGGGGMGQSRGEDYGKKMEDLDDIERTLNDLNSKNGKARPKFASLFNQAQQAIMKDDIKKAGEIALKLHEFEGLNEYEQARLHLIDYWYNGKRGNKELENEAASKLLSVGAGNVDSEAFIEAGMRLLKRQYNNQDMGGAIETLGNLRKDPASATELASIFQAVKKLDDIAEQKTDIVQKITTDEAGNWTAKIFKPQFFFTGITGEISTLGFNCTNKQTTLNYKADSVMEIPDAWGSCIMKVNAKPNTTFNFVQQQKKPS